MSDWRDSDSEQPKPRKRRKVREEKGNARQPATTPAANWRKKGSPAKSQTVAASAGRTRSWQGGQEVEEGVSATGMKRAAGIALLSILGIAATVIYFQVLFNDRVLPVIVFSPGTYSAAEFAENPFGDSVRNIFKKEFVAGGFQSHVVETPTGDNDNLLVALANEDNWTDFLSDQNLLKGNRILGGGPGNDFVVFYINALSTVAPDGKLYVATQASDPFVGLSDSGDWAANSIELSALLARLVDSVAQSANAWVILDLKTPSIVQNLSDFTPEWEALATEAFSTLSQESQDRLVVTLPGGDGQSNWLAPEYGSSFLGHYFLRILHGNFADADITGHVTLGALVENLMLRVRDDVANSRAASQVPISIPAESPLFRDELLDVKGEVTIATSRQPSVIENLRTLESFWKRLKSQEYQDAYRWDPIGYAAAESTLLALEDAAIHQTKASPSGKTAFEKLREQFDEASDAIARPQVAFGVSLTEDFERRRYFHGDQDVASELEAIRRIEDYRRQLVDAGTLPGFAKLDSAISNSDGDASDAESTATNPGDLGTGFVASFEVWRFFLEAAKTDRLVVWNRVFDPNVLRNALANIDELEDPQWLETLVLKRLLEDIEWTEGTSSARSEACAKAIMCIALSQEIASTPEPSLSWWAMDALKPIEAEHLLAAVDLLLANDFDEANRRFDAAFSKLTAVETTMERAEQAIGRAKAALHEAPHHLAWILKDSLYAAAQTHSEDLVAVAELVNEAEKIFELLAKYDIASVADRADTIVAKHQVCGKAFDALLASTSLTNTSVSVLAPSTFRSERIATLSPFLSSGQRSRLHLNTEKFLNRDLQVDLKTSEVSEQTQQGDRLFQLASDFLDNVRDDSKAAWRASLVQDLRLSSAEPNILQRLEATSLTESDELRLRSKLLFSELTQRRYANWFGPAFSMNGELRRREASTDLSGTHKMLRTWPWSSAWQSWVMGEAKRIEMQRLRLCDASWGDTELTVRTKNSDLFFYRAANQYSLPPGLPPIAEALKQYSVVSQQTLDHQAEQVRSMRAEIRATKVAESTYKGEVGAARSDSLHGVANLHLQRNSEFVQWKSSRKRLPLEFGGDQKEFLVDSRYWSNDKSPRAVMSYRGNFRSEPLGISRPQDVVTLELQRDEVKEAEIRITPPNALPEIEVMLLVDCSNSMNETMVTVPSEQGDRKLSLEDLVKRSAVQLLSVLQEIHGSEADIETRLIAFGLKKASSSQLRRQQHEVYMTNSMSADDPDLVDIVEGLTPGGNTPLFNAICLACDEATRSKTTLVFVITDGVNDLEGDSGFQVRHTISDTTTRVDKLMQSGGVFQIVHWNFTAEVSQKLGRKRFEEYKQTADYKQNKDAVLKDLQKRGFQSYTEYFASLWRSTYEKEAESMRQAWSDFYLSSKDPTLIKETLQNAVPRSKVTVQPQGGSKQESILARYGKPIFVEPKLLPANTNLSVTGPFKSANATLQLSANDVVPLVYETQGFVHYKDPFDQGAGSKRQGQPSNALGLESTVWLKAERRGRTRRLRLDFWNKKPNAFTRRPGFICAELKDSRMQEATGFETQLLADYKIACRPYPEALLPDLPQAAGDFVLRVWASDNPLNVMPKVVKPDSEDLQFELAGANVRISHRGDRIEARIEYPVPANQISSGDRVIVVCDEYQSAQRLLDGKSENPSETAIFMLAQPGDAAEIRVTTVRELEDMATEGTMAQFGF